MSVARAVSVSFAVIFFGVLLYVYYHNAPIKVSPQTVSPADGVMRESISRSNPHDMVDNHQVTVNCKHVDVYNDQCTVTVSPELTVNDTLQFLRADGIVHDIGHHQEHNNGASYMGAKVNMVRLNGKIVYTAAK